MQNGAFIWRGATAGAAGECRRASALRVGGLEEFTHEAEAGLTNVGAAGKHVKDGIDSTAEVSKGRDIWTGYRSSLLHCITVLQKAGHLKEGQKC